MTTRENNGFPLPRTDSDRRSFLRGALALATAPLIASVVNLAPGVGASGAQGTTSSLGAKGRRRLGDLEVSSIGLGCMNMAWGFGPPIGKPDAVRLLRAAYNRGVTYFDWRKSTGRS